MTQAHTLIKSLIGIVYRFPSSSSLCWSFFLGNTRSFFFCLCILFLFFLLSEAAFSFGPVYICSISAWKLRHQDFWHTTCPHHHLVNIYYQPNKNPLIHLFIYIICASNLVLSNASSPNHACVSNANQCNCYCS